MRGARVCVPPRREVERVRLVADVLDAGRHQARVRRLAPEREVVDVREIVEEQRVRPRREHVDVLAVGVRQIDREAGPVRADQKRRVRAR